MFSNAAIMKSRHFRRKLFPFPTWSAIAKQIRLFSVNKHLKVNWTSCLYHDKEGKNIYTTDEQINFTNEAEI